MGNLCEFFKKFLYLYHKLKIIIYIMNFYFYYRYSITRFKLFIKLILQWIDIQHEWIDVGFNYKIK